ncbi:MAG: ABC transporter permease [Crenarchaeota archaeon]|nr:ABC transporter permease [Thermoproteota archaeon]
MHSRGAPYYLPTAGVWRPEGAALLATVRALIWKDLVSSGRRPAELASIGVFAAAAAIVVSYATRFTSAHSAVYAVSYFLVPVFLAIFAALFSFIREAEEGTLEGLRASPAPPELIYFSKLVYSYILIEVVVVLYTVLLLFFTGVDPRLLNPWLHVLVASYSFYLAAVSSLASAMLTYSGSRGVLVPVLIMVLILPASQAYIPAYLDALSGIIHGGLTLGLWGLGGAYAFVASALSRILLEA